MADEHERSLNVRAFEQDVEIPRDSETVLGSKSRLAPASTRSVVDTHFRVCGDSGPDPSPVGAGFAKP
jgi:hypothetical protein